MKNMKNIIFCAILAISFASCSIDNYDAPNARIEGVITDQNGANLQLEQGASSARIKMEDKTWSKTPIPYYLNVKQDGTYVNAKTFAAKYAMTLVEGPFYPVAADTVNITGDTKHDFKVTPYLNVAWVTDPVADSDKKITVKFKFTRNASPTVGVNMPDLLDYQLFISTTKYVGNNNFDSNLVGPVVVVANSMEGQEISLITKTAMKYSTTYYVRVGVRVKDTYKKYNYTDIKTVVVP